MLDLSEQTQLDQFGGRKRKYKHATKETYKQIEQLRQYSIKTDESIKNAPYGKGSKNYISGDFRPRIPPQLIQDFKIAIANKRKTDPNLIQEFDIRRELLGLIIGYVNKYEN